LNVSASAATSDGSLAVSIGYQECWIEPSWPLLDFLHGQHNSTRDRVADGRSEYESHTPSKAATVIREPLQLVRLVQRHLDRAPFGA
jgi:hypothetical protein